MSNRWHVTLISSFALASGAACGDDGTGGSGGTSTTDATSVGTGGSGGSPDTTSTTGGSFATCAAIGEAIPGATMCRDEAARCSLTVPVTSTCEASCTALGKTCLRAYPESTTCVPAVEQTPLACDAALTSPAFCQCGDANVTPPEWVVVTIGDSTMDNRSTPNESGWGNELPPFAVRPDDIHNQGSSGASSLDFETRPNWPAAEALLGPNVFLLIQFGHNDTSNDPNRHTEPGEPPEYQGTYRERLLVYIEAARAAGATPVILTSLGNMNFNGDGTTQDSYMNDYVLAARKIAADEGLMLFDANRASRAEYERLGPEQTIALYSFDETTHFTPAGATRMAELSVRLGCIESETFCAQFTLP